ncbi:unnamed protein product [Closterium sp. NIES-64]|nr:unnamed protein product [Closterium sp. NIES-64]
MASPTVLTFDAKGRPIKFDVWLDDLHLYLQITAKDDVSLYDHTSGAAPAPPATADSTARSQWGASPPPFSPPLHLLLLSTSSELRESGPRLLLVGDARAAGASGARVVEVEAGAAAVEEVGGGGGGGGSGKGTGGGGAGGGTEGGGGSDGGGGGGGGAGGGGGGGAGGGHGGAVQRGGFGGGQRQQQQRPGETPSPQQLREWYSQRGGSGGGGTCPYVIRTGDRTGQTCGRFHTARRCFFRLDDAWREQFPDDSELPRWADLLKKGIDIFAVDYDAILAAMYALTISAEGDCYLSVPPDPGIDTGEAAALGACASAAPGPGEAAALGASASASAGTAPTEALHTFTLDSGASRCFFRDRTALEQLPRPVAVSLADPSGGPVLATSTTALPCPAVPSGRLSGLYLPSFSTNLVAGSALQDGGVHQFTPAYERVTHCTCARTSRHLATFTRQPGSDLCTLTTQSPRVAATASASGQLSAPCSCRSLSHRTVLWHHRLGHPSVEPLRGMHSRYLVSGLPRVLPPLPPSPAPPCLPCIEGRQRAAPHSSSFPPTEGPLQTLHLDVWGPARVRGQGNERYFLLVVDDYTRYTMVFPLRTKGEVPDVLIPWIRAARLQLCQRFQSDFPVLRLHSDRGGEFSSDLLAAYYVEHGIRQTTPRISSTSGPVSLFRRPRLLCVGRGEVGDALVFRVWGCRAFVRDTSADKLSSRAVPCVFLGFVPDAPGWRFDHPTSRRVFASQDVTFDESVPFYRLFPYRTAPLPPPPLFLTPGVPSVDPLPPQGAAPSGVSQVDPVEPVEVAVDSGPARGTECAEPGGAGSGGTETGGAELGGAEIGGAEPGGAETGGAEPGGAETGGAEPGGAATGGAEPGSAETRGAEPGGAPSSQQLREWYSQCYSLHRGAAGAGGSAGVELGGLARAVPQPEPPSPQRLREWYARRCSLRSGAPRLEVPPAGGAAGATGGAAGAGAAGGSGAAGGAAGATGGAAGACAAGGSGAAGGAAGATGGAAGARAAGGAAGATGGAAGAGAAGGSGAAGGAAGAAGGSGAAGGAAGAGAAGGAAGGPRGAVGTTGGSGATGGAARTGSAGASGAVCAASGGTSQPRPYFVPLLQQVLGQPPPPRPPPSLEFPPPVQSLSQLPPVSPLLGPSPYTGPTGGLTERCEPESRPVSPVSHHSSLPVLADPESDSLRAASPTVTRLLATAATDPSFESAAASALVAELVDFAAHCRLDYAASLVAESESVCPPSVGGECALGTDALEDRQEDLECLAAAAPHLVSMLIAPEGDPDAPDIPTPRSYAEAIAGEYSSQWQSAMDAEMASLKSIGTYVDKVPPPGANIVSGMWIFRVKRPPGSPPVFKARYVARGFSQREGVDFFQTFSPTSKMTTLRVLLHVAAQRDYELHSLDFSTAFLQGSLHEEIWLRCPPGFTGPFPPGTQWSLRRPVYGLRQAPREWHDTLRTTLAALGFAPSTADPSLFLRTDTSLPPFYILVYVYDLVFATTDTEALAHVKSEL